MSNAKILIVWSNYYEDLAAKQLASCLSLFESSEYDYQVERVDAGTYEIPTVIQYYHKHNPFDGYIPLSLLLKGKTDHYEFIWEHVKECFVQFAMNGIMIGNGIISAPHMKLLSERVDDGERVKEAFQAISYLMRLTSHRR